MSEIEPVVLRIRQLEKLLREKYHANGQGLHALISSCEERLPHRLIEDIRYIATTRNRLVNEEEFQLDDLDAFLALCDQCILELTPRSSRFIWAVAILLVLMMTGGALIFYSVHWDLVMKHLGPYFNQ